MGSKNSGPKREGGDRMNEKIARDLLAKINNGRQVLEGPSGDEEPPIAIFIRKDVAVEAVRDAYRRGGNAARGLKLPHAQDMERQMVDLKQRRLRAFRLLDSALRELSQGLNLTAGEKVRTAAAILDPRAGAAGAGGEE